MPTARRVVAFALALLAAASSCAQGTVGWSAASLDAGVPGAKPFRLELIANFSRLPALASVYSSADLAAKRKDPDYGRKLGALLRAEHPYAHRARVGNLFIGYSCVGLPFREIATRDAAGALHYDFDEIIAMLDMVVAAGFKPMLALTGTPAAMVPAADERATEPAYGCTNGPAIDWSKSNVRERTRDWWDMQHAFFEALVRHFGLPEVKQWEFATWTEPYDAARHRNSHLYYSTSSVPPERYDEAVATVIAASIDAAMASGLPIHIGNFAGDIATEYPRVVTAIARMGRGREYLSYVTGFAMSAYRTQPKHRIEAMVHAGATVQADPRMPDKPVFIDEIGELADDTGAAPPIAPLGMESAAFIAPALHEALASQMSGRRGIQRIAIWDSDIPARHDAAMADPRRVLPSAMQNVITMYARFDGLAALPVDGAPMPTLAGRTESGVYVVASAPASRHLCDAGTEIHQQVRIRGLRPRVQYEVVTRTIGPREGNPISAFFEDRPSYLCGTSRLAREGRRWTFASPEAERCFYEDGGACSWRRAAAQRAAPAERRNQLTADAEGSLPIDFDVAPGASTSIELRASAGN